MSASFLEIYNEDLRDLLVNMDRGSLAPPRGKNDKPAKLAIKRDASGKSFVDNLKGIPICTTDADLGMSELQAVMER